MKRKRKSGSDLLIIAGVALGLGIFNILIKRYVDGSLCLIAGLVTLVIWLVKRKR
jgi:hypothetical protein